MGSLSFFATAFRAIHIPSRNASRFYQHYGYDGYGHGIAHAIVNGMAWSFASHVVGAIFRTVGPLVSIAIGVALLLAFLAFRSQARFR